MKELELTNKQIERLDEIDNAAHEFLKVITNNPDLEWNMEYIGELNEAAADIMHHQGFQIYYPAIETDPDGTQRRVDYYEPNDAVNNTGDTNAPKSGQDTKDSMRFVMLVLDDQDGLDVVTYTINIMTALPDDEIIPAVRAAAQDYLNTPEGRKIYETNGCAFNYGDFDLYVTNDFCTKHGFYRDVKDIPNPCVIKDDFNTALAALGEENGNEV